jgi:hypothetical protein
MTQQDEEGSRSETTKKTRDEDENGETMTGRSGSGVRRGVS